MTYALTCLYVILYLTRPTDLIPSFRQYPLFEATCALGVLSLLVKTPRPRLFQNGTDQMMLGFLGAMAVSQVFNGWAGGALQVVIDSAPFLIGYLLIAHGIDSERKWRGFYWVLISCIVFIIYQCHQQVRDGISSMGVEPLFERSSAGGEFDVLRVRWSGPFGDPNDLAMLLAFPLPFLASNLLEKKRILSLLLLGVLGYGIYLTKSRGGTLSAIAGIMALWTLRRGTVKSLIVPGIFALLILALASGRLGEISIDSESSMGRIGAWREAMAMFRQSPLFGVGKGSFTEQYDLTAHNSLYLVLAELGMVGAFFFQMVFWIPLRDLYRMAFSARIAPPPMAIYSCGAGLVAVLVSMTFLSRAYVLMPFLAVGLWVAQGNFQKDKPPHEFFQKDGLRRYMKEGVLLLIAGILLGYVVVKILN